MAYVLFSAHLEKTNGLMETESAQFSLQYDAALVSIQALESAHTIHRRCNQCHSPASCLKRAPKPFISYRRCCGGIRATGQAQRRYFVASELFLLSATHFLDEANLPPPPLSVAGPSVPLL